MSIIGPQQLSGRLAICCFAVMLLCAPVVLKAAEYKDAENTAPKSVDDMSNTLEDIAGTILLARTPVIDAIDEWRNEQGPFWRDGHVKFNFRTMDFESEIGNIFKTQAWAAPGEIAYRSGQWRDFLTIGASLYGSYKINGNAFPGATGMLQLDGDNITTLGQAYVELDWKGVTGRFYRQALDVPYLNRNDSRMIPNTFEAYGIGREGTSLDFLLGYVDKVKLRNREDFISMREAAGVRDGDSGTRRNAFRPHVDYQDDLQTLGPRGPHRSRQSRTRFWRGALSQRRHAEAGNTDLRAPAVHTDARTEGAPSPPRSSRSPDRRSPGSEAGSRAPHPGDCRRCHAPFLSPRGQEVAGLLRKPPASPKLHGRLHTCAHKLGAYED